MDLSGPVREDPIELVTDEAKEGEEERAKKKAKRAALHFNYSVPLSFLEDAVQAAQKNDSFNMTNIGKPFGLSKEAYVRHCYEEIVNSISEQLPYKIIKDDQKTKLFIIRGSSGIGKSTFLAYFLIRFRGYFKNGKTILCHAQKTLKGNGNENENTTCQLWDGGLKLLEGSFGKIKTELVQHMDTTTLIVMDGCSLPMDLAAFRGTVIMAASPSLYVKNLEDSVVITNCKFITMPALSEQEALAIANMIGVEENVVTTNYCHMRGITRYLFEPNTAKLKVEDAVGGVNASAIAEMVSMQATSKATEAVTVHCLVLWKVDPVDNDGLRFELVSPYAESLVAKKLAIDTAVKLDMARNDMAPMSGAEAYGGALFEAFAIRTMQAGGSFHVRSLSGKADFTLEIPPMGPPVVIETNTISTAIVPHNLVRIPDGNGSFVGTLLWPTTNNFPTFDCFYFAKDGKVYPLQMTVSEKHDLKNSGAYHAKKYLDDLVLETDSHGSRTPHPAVFVVPLEMAPTYGRQNFKGNDDNNPCDMTEFFDQWVIGI